MTKLVSENQHTEFGGRFPAYDGRDSLFTAGALPFGTKELEVTLSAGCDKYVNSASPLLAAAEIRICDTIARRIVQDADGQGGDQSCPSDQPAAAEDAVGGLPH